MFRRWLIRGLFLGLLLAYIAGWVASYLYMVGFHCGIGPHVGVSALGGRIEIVYLMNYVGVRDHSYFIVEEFRTDEYEQSMKWLAQTSEPFDQFLGFYFATYGKLPRTVRYNIGIPFWFLTALSFLALAYAWRKTRPKPNPSTAFPVEIKK